MVSCSVVLFTERGTTVGTSAIKHISGLSLHVFSGISMYMY